MTANAVRCHSRLHYWRSGAQLWGGGIYGPLIFCSCAAGWALVYLLATLSPAKLVSECREGEIVIVRGLLGDL